MADPQTNRVAVYLDFDNIVMSWYDRVHGRNSYAKDRQRIAEDPTAPDVAERLAAATIDVGAIIDFAASFGTLVLTRAYADWSSPVNAVYRSQLVARAVDLVQLFPAAAYAKNGADIRLAVDAVEDMFRLPDLTHVMIVGGDSDYVPLAQRCKRLGRYVIGVGVAGSTAKSLAAACDEFEAYDSLPGVPSLPRRAPRTSAPAAASEASADDAAAGQEPAPAKSSRRRGGRGGSKEAAAESKPIEPTADSDVAADATAAETAPESDAAAAAPARTTRSRGAKAPAAEAAEAVVESSAEPEAEPEAEAEAEAPQDEDAAATRPARRPRRATSASTAAAAASAAGQGGADAGSLFLAPSTSSVMVVEDDQQDEEDPQESATRLLERALRLGVKDDSEWLHSSAVKTHMRRMDPSFSEKALGFRSFNDFVKARADVAELEETGHERLVRLHPSRS